MKSMRAPISRRTASPITPATWRWCAPASKAPRSCSPRRRRRSKRASTPRGPLRASAAFVARRRAQDARARGDRHARRGAAKKPLDRAAPRRGGGETIARGEQALLFLNRRGYAPLTLCRDCGHSFRCPNCDAWLVEHRFRRALVCHHCGHIERRPQRLPRMRGRDALARLRSRRRASRGRSGRTVPGARCSCCRRIFRAGPSGCGANSTRSQKGAFDLVIGTQLVAKGHNFPFLTLVGVVDADLGFGSGDPRAAERTFQLLAQVTGRAGRGDRRAGR